MVVKQRNIRSKSQSAPDYNSSLHSRNAEGDAGQYDYPSVQPQKQSSMMGFYALITTLFLLFTLVMGGMLWFVASQLKSDNPVQVTADDDEGEDEAQDAQGKKSSSKSKSEKQNAKGAGNEAANNIFKKLNNECGSCVVLIESQSDDESEGSSLGSGFVIYRDKDPNGESLILTNLHVANPEADTYVVQSKSGEVTEAHLAGVAKDGTDLAVLAIPNMSNLKPIWKLRSSQQIEIGDDVYTVGHPLGLDFTVSGPGKLSQKRFNEEKEAHGAILQHTAPISPGNSGGPLLDSEGNIFGINTSLAGEGNSLFFAIPIEFLHKAGAWLWRPGNADKIAQIRIQGE
ncbi:MAG: S1C family serine protease [Thermoguttaceae bacterium]|nr:S1C family serine protease [Thermoguttaceae bacterium]